MCSQVPGVPQLRHQVPDLRRHGTPFNGLPVLDVPDVQTPSVRRGYKIQEDLSTLSQSDLKIQDGH